MNRLSRILRAEGLTRTASKSYNQMVEKFGERNLRMTPKDRARIESMFQKAMKYGRGEEEAVAAKMMALAQQMARAIRHADKAYRRADAADNENFRDVAQVFYDRADELMGLTPPPTPVRTKTRTRRTRTPTVDPIVAEKESLLRQVETLLGVAVGQGTITLSQANKARSGVARAIA